MCDEKGVFDDFCISSLSDSFFGERNWLAAGYYLTKEMVDQKGEPFKPGLFIETNWNWDLSSKPEKIYIFTKLSAISDKSFSAKLFGADAGLAFRPFTKNNNLEFRVGANGAYDLGNSKGRVLPYGQVRVIF